jgi:hypothetical protein
MTNESSSVGAIPNSKVPHPRSSAYSVVPLLQYSVPIESGFRFVMISVISWFQSYMAKTWNHEFTRIITNKTTT